MKSTPDQFGMRENTASSRQHASRPLVNAICIEQENPQIQRSSARATPSTAGFENPTQVALRNAAAGQRGRRENCLLSVHEVAKLFSWVYERMRKQSTERFDKWIYPFFNGRLLADVNNLAMRDLVEHISNLAPATIRDYSNIVKAVVASAMNENGEQLFPRTWNEEFIDSPLVKHQKQPRTDKKGMENIRKEAKRRYRVLYALLAGCGPLRVSEARGLEISKHISEDCRTLYIRQKAKRGEIQLYMKTQNGERDVDLCTSLAAMLKDFIGTRTSGLLFCTSTGRQILQTDILRDSLHPILKKLEHVKGGFNIFRRFRITELQTAECPKPLQHFWSGHAQTHVSERYIKLLQDRDYRLERAEKIGMGFELPAVSVAPRAPLILFRKAG